jgi:hypothetical protein
MTGKEFVAEALRDIGKQKALNLRAKVVANEVDDTSLIEQEELVPNWKAIDYSNFEIGTPVRDPSDGTGQVYKLLQKHDATGHDDWNPAAAVSLWDIAHTKDPAKAKPYVEPQGTRGMYMKDDVMVWTNGMVYKSTIDNNVYTPEVRGNYWSVVE